MVQHPVGGENQTRGNPGSILESEEEKTVGVGIEGRGWGSADFRVGVKESLSEKVTLKLRSGSHEAANQDRSQGLKLQEVCASGTSRMQLSGPRFREPARKWGAGGMGQKEAGGESWG